MKKGVGTQHPLDKGTTRGIAVEWVFVRCERTIGSRVSSNKMNMFPVLLPVEGVIFLRENPRKYGVTNLGYGCQGNKVYETQEQFSDRCCLEVRKEVRRAVVEYHVHPEITPSLLNPGVD